MNHPREAMLFKRRGLFVISGGGKLLALAMGSCRFDEQNKPATAADTTERSSTEKNNTRKGPVNEPFLVYMVVIKGMYINHSKNIRPPNPKSGVFVIISHVVNHVRNVFDIMLGFSVGWNATILFNSSATRVVTSQG